MIDRNEVLALAGKWRVDADEYTKIGCIGLSAIKQDCADELEALAAKPEPQGGEVDLDILEAAEAVGLLPLLHGFSEEGKRVTLGAFLDLAHPAPKPAEGEGWVLVPVEPTPEMLVAGFLSVSNGFTISHPSDAPGLVYRAMLAAAPKRGRE